MAQVASVGGYPIEYQIDVDPNKLRAYGVTLGELFNAVARSNSSVGGRVIHKGNAEYLIRSVGWICSLVDIEQIVVLRRPGQGAPLTVANLASVALGPQFRRSVLEKDGSEAVGAVVMMRYGENPLAVTRRSRQDRPASAGPAPGRADRPLLRPHAADRGRRPHARRNPRHGDAHRLRRHPPDPHAPPHAVVICLTLPLAVLASFILMRQFGVASNIMSLSGIAISIGALVNQAIVMVENATHHLTAHFGSEPVRGDTRAIVLPACRTVGRPIFFSVMIILLSFIPVFALTGIDGKLFHPLAFTKSFAMVGVAILSITLVPALIPSFIRGRLRSEEESWLVRSLIHIYKPLLTWAMPRRNFVMWSFAALLIAGAGLFPLQAVFGVSWHTGFLGVVAVTTAITVILTVGWRQQIAAFLSLAALSMAAYNFPKIGVVHMPSLDEGSILDMPVTVPRASVAETADDLKARDAMLRRFPEVEMVVGKSGGAETPTDPSPLEMLETIVTLRPKEFWPKRMLRYADAGRQAGVVIEALAGRGLLQPPAAKSDRDALVNTVDDCRHGPNGRGAAGVERRAPSPVPAPSLGRGSCASSSPS